MKIKEKKRKNCNTFDFYCDLLDNNYLYNFLKFFQVQEIEMIIYGFYSEKIFNQVLLNFNSKDTSFKSSRDIVVYLNLNELSKLLELINYDYDEFVIFPDEKTEKDDFILYFNHEGDFDVKLYCFGEKREITKNDIAYILD